MVTILFVVEESIVGKNILWRNGAANWERAFRRTLAYRFVKMLGDSVGKVTITIIPVERYYSKKIKYTSVQMDDHWTTVQRIIQPKVVIQFGETVAEQVDKLAPQVLCRITPHSDSLDNWAQLNEASNRIKAFIHQEKLGSN